MVQATGTSAGSHEPPCHQSPAVVCGRRDLAVAQAVVGEGEEATRSTSSSALRSDVPPPRRVTEHDGSVTKSSILSEARRPGVVGRRSKLTASSQQRIVDSILAGNYQDTAAAHAGIGESTFHSWMARGRAEQARLDALGARSKGSEAPYLEFLEAITHARAVVEARNVGQLQSAARGGSVTERRTVTHADGRTEVVERITPPDWRATAWWLERSFPVRWGRRDQLAVTGAEGGPVETESSAVADLLAKLDEMGAKLRTPVFGPPPSSINDGSNSPEATGT